jgi:hypothetical protein
VREALVSETNRGLATKAIQRAFLKAVPIRYPYLFFLDLIHQYVRPRTYVEIGVSKGMALALALPGTRAIGVDPKPQVCFPLRSRTQVFREESDDFFAHHDVRDLLGGLPVDLAFIDGMHHFEFALRDFMHLEMCSHEGTTVLVHDCYPINRETASRVRSSEYWSGDVWKLALCLRRWRPDLTFNVIDVGPTGLGVITGLRPDSRVLDEHYQEIVDEVIDVPYEYLEENDKDEVLNRVPASWTKVRPLMAHHPFRSVPVNVLTAARAMSAASSKARGNNPARV